MEKIKLHVREVELREKLDRIEARIYPLQEIANLLTQIGVKNLSIRDVVDVCEANGNGPLVKKLVLRGRNLSVDGIRIDPASFSLPVETLKQIESSARKAPKEIDFSYYDLVDGIVKCRCEVEEQLRENFTLYGSKRVKSVVDEVQILCDQANLIYESISCHTYHPLRPIDTWMTFDGKKFIPNVFNLQQHVK